MIPQGCNIQYPSDWFLLGRYFDIRTVAYLQTVSLILQVFSSFVNLLKILGAERSIGCAYVFLKSYLFSKLLEVLKVNLKYIRKKEDDLVGLHFPLLHPFLYENLWLTRLGLRHSRKVDSHNFLSLSTPVKTEKKERRKTSGKSTTLIMHINYTLFSFRWGLNFLNLLTLDKALE